ncbi:MAG: ATP-dependent Clp protease ATP-binding subunit [Acidobacteriota bacterium]
MPIEDDTPIRRALVFARYEASRLARTEVASEHLLLGLTRLGDEDSLALLEQFRLTPEVIRERIGGRRTGPIAAAAAGLPLTEEAEQVMESAHAEARKAPSGSTSAICMVLGMLSHPECGGAKLLLEHGLDLATARLRANELLAARGVEVQGAATPLLDEFGRDLVEIAARGGFDPLIGRNREVERLQRVLMQRLKSNPVLVGEPGVGKTAVVEGLAQRLADGTMPEPLRGKRLVSLDLAAVVAGARYRGQFEERLRGIVDEIEEQRDVILFVDEIHTLVGAGALDGALDAANILKPALAQGRVSLIGATTPREFKQRIEKDRALVRRFQRIDIAPPTVAEAIDILRGLAPRYEAFHGLQYSEQALRAAVIQSDRYIAERHLPDKAIDMLDQAAAWANLRRFDDAAVDATPRSEIVVGRDEIDEVVAAATGIPAARLRADEAERLKALESRLSQWIVGQTQAIEAVSRAVRRSRLGLGNRRRPIGSFLCVGPSGVGKTELARRLAEILFDRDDALLRFDMSEYMERHAVAKLIGSPPGYVGFEDGGQLTEAIRRQPYSVVLFDEIEKAHPDLANILLQIFEDGHLTDSEGRRVDFSNTVVLLTSNVGSRLLRDDSTIGFGSGDNDARRRRLEATLHSELRRAFRPELLDRLDETLVFHALSHDELRDVVGLQLRDVETLLAERDIELRVSEPTLDWLVARANVGAETGARPLRRTVQREIQDALSEELIGSGRLVASVRVDVDGGELAFELSEDRVPAETAGEDASAAPKSTLDGIQGQASK